MTRSKMMTGLAVAGLLLMAAPAEVQANRAISQIGGINTGGIYTQATYQSQVATGIAQGLRMHTYIWYQVGGDKQAAKQCMDYFLARIQTPKGSIVALDYEDGASATRTRSCMVCGA